MTWLLLFKHSKQNANHLLPTKILNKEIDKAELTIQAEAKQFVAMIEELIHGTSDDALDAITEALEYKIFCR